MLKLVLLSVVLCSAFVAVLSTESYDNDSDTTSSSSESSSGSTECRRPVLTCKKPEVYSDCVNGRCDARNCSQLGYQVPCVKLNPAACIEGCVCDQGYVRNDKGKCVLKKQCPSCGGDPNAVSSECGNNCRNQCSNLNKKNVVCPDICYVNGCECRKGYVFDQNLKKCVKPDKCTPTCKIHEVYSDCINGGCDARNCSQVGYPVPCVKLDPAACIKGCVCEEGYVRNDKGKCIPKKECPSCGGDKNAVSSTCGNNCLNQCSNLNKTGVACPKICRFNGCECRKGYVLDENLGICVLPKQCTPTCKDHEVFSNCTNSGCDAENCSQLGYSVSCVQVEAAACIKGCVCEEGYVRNDKGKCIPKTECPSCGGDPNAVSSVCGNNCANDCANRNKTNVVCPLFCILNGCECKKGYNYDGTTGKCVLPDQCPITCNDNEEYSNCTNVGCNAKSCSQLGFPVTCVDYDDSKACVKGCACVNDYVRADNGTCIPRDQCSSCGGDPNAGPGCGINCGRHCSNYMVKRPICPRIACLINRCDCKPDYVYDDNINKCVLPQDCTPTCGLYEVYSNCSNGLCKFQNCNQYGQPRPYCPRFDPNNCKGSCICDDGYLRNPAGECIPQEECPAALCSSANHEVYSNCTNGGGVPRNCSQVGLPCPNVDPADCVRGCICEDNYLRDGSGNCIPKEQCPIVCKENEVYSNCTNGGCDVQNCSQMGYRVNCLDYNSASCQKGCACVGGYLRADNGTCIPRDQCPSCGGDPNAGPGCGNCGRYCSDYMNPRPICPLRPCFITDCQCKPDYVYDSNLNKCVLPKDCTPTCKNNEIYSDCANGLCKFQNCTQYGQPLPFCPRFDRSNCKGYCICQDGYLRNPAGVCIPQEQCPAALCPSANHEVYSNCTNGGGVPRNCSQKGLPCPDVDPADCVRGCICENNYLRDGNGNCIPTEQCPQKCKEHEMYSSCANAICGAQNCTQYNMPPLYCPRMEESLCRGGCICENNYLRNDRGFCIPRNQCPEACQTEEPTSPGDEVNCTDALQRFLDGNTAFTGNFLNEMVKKNVGNSLVMSPFSVLIPLAILATGTAKGESYNQLLGALNLRNDDEIRCVFPQLIRYYQSQTQSVLNLAAKVYVGLNERLQENFKNTTKNVFDAESESIDFGDPSKAADIINKWVEEKTNSRIKDLVSPSMFSKLTRLVLTNAIYFLGSWIKQFNPKSTYDRDFYISENQTIKRQTMYREGSFKYAEVTSLDAKVLEIPFKGNFSYVAILPNTKLGYVDLVQNLKDQGVLANVLNQLSFTMCKVYLPRYETTTSIDLSYILKQLNITDLFDGNKAQLTGLIEGNEKLAVNAAVQKANIAVNEIGAEAAAANAIIVGATAVRQTNIFDANHPFVYYILIDRTPLFCGVVTAT